MISGSAAWIIFKFITPGIPSDMIGLVFSFLAMILVTMFTKDKTPAYSLQDADGVTILYKDRLGILK
jgi:hypothetical protein